MEFCKIDPRQLRLPSPNGTTLSSGTKFPSETELLFLFIANRLPSHFLTLSHSTA
jgi:hypothetical protein